MKKHKGIKTYYSGLGESKPEADIELKQSIMSNRSRIVTPLSLSGNGITYHDTYNKSNCTNPSYYGQHIYYVTPNALKQLERKYAIAQELLF